MKYHSALHKPNNYPVVEWIQLGNSLAFVHDLMTNVPVQYNKCDIIYAEIPWVAGFEIFEARANIEQNRSYQDFMIGINKFITALNKPAIIVGGKKGLRYLPTPDIETGTVLNGAPARAVMYQTKVENVDNALTILNELATKYNCIGDPCCGFGRSAKIFKQAGKNFVVSDYNKECIGYIAQEWGGW
jgi:hypothetical protein